MLTINRLSAAEASIIVDGARQQALAIGVPMCIAVTDESGTLIAFQRMDGGKVHSVQVAIDKAFSAASARRATHEIATFAQPDGPLFGINASNGGRFSIVGGGLPISVEGEVVGGIGVSSGTPAEDRACAEAGVTAFARYWASLDRTGPRAA